MRVFVLAGLTGMAALASVANATQVSYGFTNITNNGGIGGNYNSQFSVTVSDEGAGLGANQVDFIFRNNVGLASSICDVYFDDGTLLGIASISSTPGVAFTQNASPGNLPGGNAVNFETTAGFSLDSNSPVLTNGVNTASESLTVRFNLINGQTFANVINALNGGSDLRIGIHVQGQANDQSNSYVTLIPLPAGVWIGMAGLAGIGGMGWLRRRSHLA